MAGALRMTEAQFIGGYEHDLQQFMPYDYIPVDIKTEPFMPETAHGPYIQIIEEPKQVRLASYFLFLYKHDEAAAETRRHPEHIADCVSLQSRPLCRKDTLCIMDDVTSCRFSNLGILHVTKKGVVEVLSRRLREEKKRLKGPHCHLTDVEESAIVKEAKELGKTMDLNIVRLKFTAYLQDSTGAFTRALKPVVSNPIYDSTLQYAIVFKTPAYHSTEIERPVTVFLQLRRKKAGDSSDPKQFTYIPQVLDKEEVLRKKQKPLPHYEHWRGGRGGGGGGAGGFGGSGGGGFQFHQEMNGAGGGAGTGGFFNVSFPGFGNGGGAQMSGSAPQSGAAQQQTDRQTGGQSDSPLRQQLLQIAAALNSRVSQSARQTATALLQYCSTGDARVLLAIQRHLCGIQDGNGDTPLHLAVIHHQTGVIQQLIHTLLSSQQQGIVNTANHLQQVSSSPSCLFLQKLADQVFSAGELCVATSPLQVRKVLSPSKSPKSDRRGGGNIRPTTSSAEEGERAGLDEDTLSRLVDVLSVGDVPWKKLAEKLGMMTLTHLYQDSPAPCRQLLRHYKLGGGAVEGLVEALQSLGLTEGVRLLRNAELRDDKHNTDVTVDSGFGSQPMEDVEPPAGVQ
ncbi:nuclear factor NF-kappa-B p100 subunit [Neolamprologus brichardi]|uniref:nuclear factor NF-kappa-B p100 subunit n=1 Tax=Neolamprologus brichardi TaxID=32507 RepID=UPI001643E14D|nr:nuclear factor NF-kappa-B p100 subunit [Neolamprologus brichardi]